MKSPVFRLVLALLLGSVLSACRGTFLHPFATTRPSADEVSAARMQKTVSYLASDELEGRGPDTPGLEKAADFLAKRAEEIGLKPVRGADGYFQHFNMRAETKLDAESTTLAIADAPLKLDTDFRPYSMSASTNFSAPVTFVGYGVSAADKGYNDFEGVNLQGRVALAMRYEPHDPAGKPRLETGFDQYSDVVTKAENAAKAGAVALLMVHPPNHHGDEALQRFDRRFSSQPSAIPVIQVTQKVANDLLSRGGVRDLKTLQELIDAEFKPASAELDEKVLVNGNVGISRKEIPVKNVVAALPGRGKHAGEWIVVGAHYDHLGYGGRGSLAGPTTRAIHNGADDNASGSAAILELAERFARRRFGLPRSVLFIWFSGEESGLLGSEYYVKNPLVPLDSTVAMFNLDMVGRMNKETLIVGGRETAPAFDSLINEISTHYPSLKLSRMSRMTFGASDHAPFMGRKIPVLFLFTGLHSDYHRPTDDIEKINFPGMAEVVDFSQDIVTALASMPRQPYTAPPPTSRPTTSSTNRSDARPQLGIIPVYSEEADIGGILISGTTPNTAAAAAGLKDKDIIQAINGRRMRTLEDLMEFLDGAKVDEEITLHILRDQKPMDLQTRLKARQGD